MMKQSAADKRNYGIDLFKIISMFFVVVLHICGRGGVLYAEGMAKPKLMSIWLLEISAYCAVNCFALATGYLMYNRKFRYRKIAYLWADVFFYTVVLALFAKTILANNSDIKVILTDFFPLMSNSYWYFTAYFCMFFFIPFLNRLLEALTEKESLILAGTLFTVFSVLPSVAPWGTISFGMSEYSVWLLIYMYIIGAVIKKCRVMSQLSAGKAFGGYCAMVAITWSSKYIFEAMRASGNGFAAQFAMMYDKSVLINFTSPTVVMMSVFLLTICLNVKALQSSKEQNSKTQMFLQWMSPMVFYVYIIHENKFIREYFITDKFAGYAQYNIPEMLLATLLTALGIFALCIFIEWVRSKIFKVLKIKTLIDKTADFISGRVKCIAVK